jgi:hypothetical protein
MLLMSVTATRLVVPQSESGKLDVVCLVDSPRSGLASGGIAEEIGDSIHVTDTASTTFSPDYVCGSISRNTVTNWSRSKVG